MYCLQAIACSASFLRGDVVAIDDSDDEQEDTKSKTSAPSSQKVGTLPATSSGTSGGQKAGDKANADKADKRLKKLVGPNFVSHRKASYSKSDSAVKSMKQKIEAASESGNEALELVKARGGIDDDKALQAYVEAAHRSKHWCECVRAGHHQEQSRR